MPPDVVSYLDRAFTVRGLRDNIVGKKRRNYPQRSGIIKKDPITGKLMFPNGQPTDTQVNENMRAKIIENTETEITFQNTADKEMETVMTRRTVTVEKENANRPLTSIHFTRNLVL